MQGGIVGRDVELRVVEELIDDVAGGPAVLVLLGEAGIGKTSVWLEAVERARGHGFTVLSCRAAATEVRLSYAGLSDLLSGNGADDFEDLPAPQRRALDAALLRGSADDAVPDPRAVAAGFLSVLGGLAARGPVLLAIDDVQWLDESTLRVVQFAARRCSGPVAMLFAQRIEDHGSPVVDISPAEPARRRAVRLGALSLGALHHVVKTHTGRSLPRRALVHIAGVSAGNPFFALELARALDTTSSNLAVLPGSLRAVVRGRLEPLASTTVEALNVVSALANPRVDLVSSALGGASAEELLGPAEDARVIEIAGGVIHFTHPLLATAVYAEMAPTSRRSLHKRLGGIVDDVEERARHLALAAVGHDAEAMAALDEAAAHARRRGAPDAAAELLEQAIALGGNDDPARWVQAAEEHFRADHIARARELLETVIARLEPDLLRARALARLGLLRFEIDRSPEAGALLEQAVREADGDLHLRARAAMELCWVLLASVGGHASDCWPYATLALIDAERSGEPGLIAEALAVRTHAAFVLGKGVDEPALARALALEDPDRPTSVQIQPLMIAAKLYRWTHRLDEAQAAFAAVRRRCIERGAETDLWGVDAWLIQTACWAGDIATAEELVHGYVERSQLAETSQWRAFTRISQADLSAWVGRVDEARAAVEEALQLYTDDTAPMYTHRACEPLCMAELSAGNFEAVVRHGYPALKAAIGDDEPAALLPRTDDVIEALVMSDRLDEAEPLVDWLETDGRQPDHWWARAVGARCRALLLAARGQPDEAQAVFEQALTAHDQLPQLRYERARTLLVAGQCQRRRGKRRAAHTYLSEAVRLFDEVGTARWAENARAELGRLGLQPGASNKLTATELHVAELAATGLTNREVAATLLVSAKTVEAHLGRIYRKLGIRSRAELGRHMAHASGSAVQTNQN